MKAKSMAAQRVRGVRPSYRIRPHPLSPCCAARSAARGAPACQPSYLNDKLQPRPIRQHLAALDLDVELGHFGHAQVPQRLARRFDRVCAQRLPTTYRCCRRRRSRDRRLRARVFFWPWLSPRSVDSDCLVACRCPARRSTRPAGGHPHDTHLAAPRTTAADASQRAASRRAASAPRARRERPLIRCSMRVCDGDAMNDDPHGTYFPRWTVSTTA